MGICQSNPEFLTWNDTIAFIPPITGGQVIKVYDGDTITIATKLPYSKTVPYRFSVRIRGIDCPEIKTKCSTEKHCAEIAKNKLADLILHKTVSLKNVGNEKYGRILADVYYDGINCGEWLYEQRLAVKYDGKTKKCPADWMAYYVGSDA